MHTKTKNKIFFQKKIHDRKQTFYGPKNLQAKFGKILSQEKQQ